MVSKKERYFVSAIANALIGLFFLIYFYRISQVEFTYSIGLIVLTVAFLIKALADYLYAVHPTERARKIFHYYTYLHYLLAGIILLLFPYFGYLYSFLFAALSLMFAYYEYRHTMQLEDEIFRIRRHLMATAFRGFVGSLIFFDSLFYNVINPTWFGWVITIVGTLFGIYILYSALTTYRYLVNTSKIPIRYALIQLQPE